MIQDGVLASMAPIEQLKWEDGAMQAQIGMHTGCRAVAGTILVLAGGVLALAELGVVSSYELERSWPVFLIVAGIAQLAVTLRQDRQRGWGLLLLGDFFFVNTM